MARKTFPGPKARKVLRDSAKYGARTTQTSSVIIDNNENSREGTWVRTIDGELFLDLHCDAGVMSGGGANKAVSEAIIRQVKTGNLDSEHNNAPVIQAVELEKLLALKTPVKKPSKVFLSNSGTEANEAAHKLCKAYRKTTGEPERTVAIYFWNSFHGRTAGNAAATTSNPEKQRDAFWTHCDKNNSYYITYPHRWDMVSSSQAIEDLEKINLKYVDRILVEMPCQGEGGIIPADENAMRTIYEKTQEAGVVWIADAVQCGMGRVGTLFGSDAFSWMNPDILTLGKALGGGLAIGATVFRADMDWPEFGMHSNTFGGNPITASSAVAAYKDFCRIIRSGAVRKIEKILDKELRKFLSNKHVTDIRGIGAMWAVEFTTPAIRDKFKDIAENKLVLMEGIGLRVLSAGAKSVRVMPPLVITKPELKQAMDLFGKALKALG